MEFIYAQIATTCTSNMILLKIRYFQSSKSKLHCSKVKKKRKYKALSQQNEHHIHKIMYCYIAYLGCFKCTKNLFNAYKLRISLIIFIYKC